MAFKANMVIDQGSDFATSIYLWDDNGDILPDVGTLTAAAQMRKWYSSTTAINFTTTIITETGELRLTLTNAQTSNITAGRYVYDVEVTTSANVVTRIVEGMVTVTPGVTR
jgi:hypothetical protein